MIPMAMRLKVRRKTEDGERGVNLWIPLVFAWILLLPVFVLIAVVWLLLRALSPMSGEILRVVSFIESAAAVLWKIDGLRIDVRDRESRFVLHF